MREIILQTSRKLDGVRAVYGMGSYFRGEPFNDVDLVVVLAASARPIADLGSEIRVAFAALAQTFAVPLDVTIFTETEFAERPLRDMHTLVPIFDRDTEG